jgi:histidinol-phosphate aminotransferase
MEEGTECIYSNPAFGPYRGFPKKVGATSINVPLIGPDFQLDIKGILAAINEKTRLVFVTNPNNPTGTYIPKAQIDALVEQLPEHVILVYDEVYFHFADAADYVQAIPYVLAGKNIIAINSFSKAYGLAGLRVGYSYSTPEIATYLQQLRRPFQINTLSMEAAIAALQDHDFIKETAQKVATEKAFLYQQLDQIGFKYWKSQANFILIQPPITPKEFEQFVLADGIMVRPVAGFGAPDCVRVTIGTREANRLFISACSRLLETLKA